MESKRLLQNMFNAMVFSLLIISIKFEFSEIINSNPIYHIYIGFVLTLLNSLFTGIGFIAGISIFTFIKKKLKNEKFFLFVGRVFYGKAWDYRY